MKLEDLEAYLRQDPNNNALLLDTFSAALYQKDWPRAEFYLRHAQSLNVQPEVWLLREGDFWLAQQHWDHAQEVLQKLQTQLETAADAPAELRNTVAHNLAYIEFRRGDFIACVALLSPLVETSSAQAVHPSLVHLWLRAMHRVYELDRAYDWATQQEQQHTLDAIAAGIASLIALDANHFPAARRWADLALAQPNAEQHAVEAMITRASLALGDQDVATVKKYTDAALVLNPNDGRSWSARAFADMLNNDVAAAYKHFALALQHMPGHIGTWYGLGILQILQNDLDAAKATFENALALDHNFSECQGGMGLVLALQGHREQAQEHVERALRLDRESVSGRYAQAILNGEVRDAESMRKVLKDIMGVRAQWRGGAGKAE